MSLRDFLAGAALPYRGYNFKPLVATLRGGTCTVSRGGRALFDVAMDAPRARAFYANVTRGGDDG